MARAVSVDFSQLRDFANEIEEKLGGQAGQEFIEKCAKELASRLLTRVIRRTPVGQYKDRVGGTLIRGWTAEQQQNVSTYVRSLNVARNGDTYTIEIVNPVEYAPYVEFGHRTRNGGWVEGKFMLTISSQEIQNAAPGILEKKLQKKLSEVFK